MENHCEAATTIERMRSGWWTPVTFVGGSLTVGTGCSNTAMHSWRRLFVRYLHDRYERTYHCRIGDVMLGIGAMPSFGMAFLISRYVDQKKPTLVFLEHCVNDQGCQQPELVRKGIEGLLRQFRAVDSNPDIVVLCAPTRPGNETAEKTRVAFELHKEVARHYGASVLDVNEYVHRVLAERGQDWDAVGIDNFHMNDYGNRLWFECLREWFEKQVQRFDEYPLSNRSPQLPAPLYSDELQFTRLIDPSKKSRHITLEGDWQRGDDLSCPWWFDRIFVGRPGARLTFRFEGTAIGIVHVMQPNGLKIEMVLDGKEIVGPYTNWVADFANFQLLGHGMENTQHTLELTISGPMRGKNQEDPTARIAYLCVAGGKAES